MIIEEDCEEADREEKSLSGRLLAPRATDEWLNEVPVGILKQASIHCHTALDYKAVSICICASACICICSITVHTQLYFLVVALTCFPEVAKQHDRHAREAKEEAGIVNLES